MSQLADRISRYIDEAAQKYAQPNSERARKTKTRELLEPAGAAGTHRQHGETDAADVQS